MGLPQTSLIVCAATWMELCTFDPRLSPSVEQTGFGRLGEILFIVTGVGIPRALERSLLIAGREQPKRIVNIGIAGAYPGSGLSIGDVVIGASEVYGDLGMELPDAPGFQALHDTPFGADYSEPFALQTVPTDIATPRGRGCTVNSCTGTHETGLRRERLFSAAFETMEGAAVAQAGHAFGIPVTEIRAISNIAARRDMRPENIRLALSRLTAYLEHCREAFYD